MKNTVSPQHDQPASTQQPAAVAPLQQAWSLNALVLLLLQSWLQLVSISFFLYAPTRALTSPSSVGLNDLPLQLTIFTTSFLILLLCKFKFPHWDTWAFSTFLTSLMLVAFSLSSSSFSLRLGLFLLSLPLLWSLRTSAHASCSWGKRLLFALNVSSVLALLILLLLLLPTYISLPAARLEALDLYSKPPGEAAASELMQRLFSNNEAWFVLLACTAVAIFFSIFLARTYVLRQKQDLTAPNSWWQVVILLLLVGAAASLHCFFLGRLMLARVQSFSTPTYDFGLFKQMFHYMDKTGLPFTTLERDGLISHFKIHLSPIFYLYLPFFMLWPTGECLQLLQVLTVISGIVPLALICQKLKLSVWVQSLVLCLFFALPGLLSSSFYDLHENCFLVPLCLWLFYAVLHNRLLPLLLSSLLLLTVKEDAFLYVIAIGLWQLFAYAPTLKSQAALTKARFNAALIILLAAAVFSFQYFWLMQSGTGAMSYRFANLMIYPKLGLLGIPFTFLQNPFFLLQTVFTSAKLRYLLITLLSFGFLPLFSKRRGDYLLFLPLLFMNLFSTYFYQYKFSFQYSYGSHACLLCLLVYIVAQKQQELQDTITLISSEGYGSSSSKQRNLADSRYGACLALVLAALLFSGYFSAKAIESQDFYVANAANSKEKFDSMRATLAKLPRDKSIACSTFISTALADCPELYDIANHESIKYGRDVAYLALDLREQSAWQEAVAEWYLDHGYAYVEELSGPWIAVLGKKQS